MAFLRSITRPEVAPLVMGDGVYLRGPTMGDYSEWAELRTRSRAYLTPWEPTWPPDDLTRAAFRRRLRRYMRDVREDLAYPFFVFREDDDALVGGMTISNVHRGVQQSCTLGYWAGEIYSGNGYTTAAVRALACFIFDELQLHRIQDRKSTRLNSSHDQISYAVFCLKKKKMKEPVTVTEVRTL